LMGTSFPCFFLCSLFFKYSLTIWQWHLLLHHIYIIISRITIFSSYLFHLHLIFYLISSYYHYFSCCISLFSWLIPIGSIDFISG
jgi:hypothetical protein